MANLPYRDRAEAGQRLAEALGMLDLDRPVILGVPRGGVVVAAPVAAALDGELDVIVVRKLGAPRNPELGIGAVGADGDPVLDDRLLSTLGVDEPYLSREVSEQRQEARRRMEAYRGDRPSPQVSGRDVVVVDDGIATGGTVTVAASLLRARQPAKLVLGVPVAPREAIDRLQLVYDEVVCLSTPEPYMAVGQWFSDFRQISDDEVRSALAG